MQALQPMNELEYMAWLAKTVPAYAADKVASGQWEQNQALELSAAEYAELLPQGLGTPDNHLYTVRDAAGLRVGMLWFAVKTKFGSRIAYVYDVSVDEMYTRQGHATRAFHALEQEVLRLGLAGVALHVFGHNIGAQALYAKLGYEPTNISLYKRVAPDA